METIIIRPNKKLLTKIFLVVLIWSFFIALIGLLLQILIPLSKEKTPTEVANTLWPIIADIILFLWVTVIPPSIIWVKNLRYEIGDERITIRKGIISHIEQNILFKMITDFSLHRSLLDRYLGIGSLRMQTAGQSPTSTGYEGILAGLTNWDEMLVVLRERIKNSKEFNIKHTTESATAEKEILLKILDETKAIRELLENNK